MSGARKKVRRVPRDRGRPLKAYVTPADRKTIEERARAAGLTMSSYVRAACLGLKTSSSVDRNAVDDLAKVNADQGRLGGLLKMYLQTCNPDRRSAERLLAEIEDVQVMLKDAAKRVPAA